MGFGIVVVPTSVLVLLVGLQAAPRSVDDDGIRTVIAAYQEALNAGDAARIADLCTVDAVIMLPDTAQRQGHAAILSLFENDVVGAATFNETFTPIEVLLFDGWGFARANITGTFTLKRTGRVVSVKDRQAVFLFTRTGSGPWKIARFVVHIGEPS